MNYADIAETLRRLSAHIDVNDPTRKPGRRAGTTISPYSCDFEFDEAALIADIRKAMEALARLRESFT